MEVSAPAVCRFPGNIPVLPGAVKTGLLIPVIKNRSIPSRNL